MNQDQQEAFRKLLALQITELELAVSTSNALYNRGIHTILDLVNTPESALKKFVGRRRIEEIQNNLRQLGLSQFEFNRSKKGSTTV
jgi:DNA-directed RNA polymerase alpha subunit